MNSRRDNKPADVDTDLQQPAATQHPSTHDSDIDEETTEAAFAQAMDENELDADALPSKSQLKREAQELFNLGVQLVELGGMERAAIPMDSVLDDAVTLGASITAHSARKRQLLYIGKLLRKRDVTDIRAALDAISARSRGVAQRHKATEQWRERLLENEKQALSELIDTYGQRVNVQSLRQLIRKARQERQRQAPPTAQRQLFRLLRDLVEGDGADQHPDA